MTSKSLLTAFLALILFSGATAFHSSADAANGDTLLGDAFVSPSYNNWVETYPDDGGRWGINIGNGTMMENSGGPVGTGTAQVGDYTPHILLQDGVTTGVDYSVSARMYTSDDDGFGLVFGYQDNDNYFRVGMREQSGGSLGFTQGLSVQKVVGGTITQISPAGLGPGDTSVPTQAMIDGHLPIDMTIDVTGTSWSVSVAGINSGDPIISGTDGDLTGGKAGIHSWYQFADSSSLPGWGTEADDFIIRDGGGSELFNDNFDEPLKWRAHNMTNSAGEMNPVSVVDAGRTFLRWSTRSIYDDTNGYRSATETTPNIDFMGPSFVVDEPGSENLDDYRMRIRILNPDNDGAGVLVRVQDDDTFYRVNFTNETHLPSTTWDAWERAPQGMSVQKSIDGVWTELFRDETEFIPTPGEPFDLDVRAEGDQLIIRVTEDPDAERLVGPGPYVHEYPIITDGTDPLLTGTVGITTWGSDNIEWMNFRGVPGPLVTEIPEPSTLCLTLLAGLALLWRRRG